MRNKYYTSRDPIKNYFPLPNEVFALGLSPGALAVYSYLMYIEIGRHISAMRATGRLGAQSI